MSSQRSASLKWLQVFTVVIWLVSILGFVVGKVLFSAADMARGETGLVFVSLGYELTQLAALVPAAVVVTAILLHARHAAELATRNAAAPAVRD